MVTRRQELIRGTVAYWHRGHAGGAASIPDREYEVVTYKAGGTVKVSKIVAKKARDRGELLESPSTPTKKR